MYSMNYNDFFGKALAAAYRKAPMTDDKTFMKIVKERASKMEKKNFKLKKPAAIAASIAAAAALTVSVGAALGWDIASLFMNEAAIEREGYAEISEKTLRDYYQNEGYTVHGVSAETEYDILQALSHEIDSDFNVAGHEVHITGYAYDGHWLELLYEVKFDEGVPDGEMDRFPISINFASNDSRFEEPGWLTHITQATADTIKYHSYHEIALPDDLDLRILVVPHDDNLRAHIQGMAYETESYVDISLSGTNKYSLSKEVSYSVNVDNDVINIRNISISPFGVVLKGTRNERSIESTDLTVLAVFNDGTVTDMAGRTGGSDITSDGMTEFTSSFSSHGVLLDAREITELRIGDTVIPVNG